VPVPCTALLLRACSGSFTRIRQTYFRTYTICDSRSEWDSICADNAALIKRASARVTSP
jgi:hypothetical protein